jgi:hypothetical protein
MDSGVESRVALTMSGLLRTKSEQTALQNFAVILVLKHSIQTFSWYKPNIDEFGRTCGVDCTKGRALQEGT